MKEINIVILTGSGISAESGIPTFRDSGGIWENENVDEIASLEGLIEDPLKVHNFYNNYREKLNNKEPNVAHYELTRLQKHFGSENVSIITQNIDDLHEKSGSENVIHMHGSIFEMKNLKNNNIKIVRDKIKFNKKYRPNIVFFGEGVFHFQKILNLLTDADLFISIGTSGTVFPANDFLSIIKYNKNNTKLVQVNLENDNSQKFDINYIGYATKMVKEMVNDIIYDRV